MKIYGIRNCDTVKKARKFLEEVEVEYIFHDYKKDGVEEAKLRTFIEEFGWEVILNRKGTTWRKLDDEIKSGIVEAEGAIELMIENPSLIKRPLAEGAKKNLVGFDPVAWEMALELGELA